MKKNKQRNGAVRRVRKLDERTEDRNLRTFLHSLECIQQIRKGGKYGIK